MNETGACKKCVQQYCKKAVNKKTKSLNFDERLCLMGFY